MTRRVMMGLALAVVLSSCSSDPTGQGPSAAAATIESLDTTELRVEHDRKAPTGSLGEWTGEDSKDLRQALLDVRSIALSVRSGLVNADTAMVTAAGSPTPRTLASRFADTVNVNDFGAVGDRVTDDAAAIQAAHDALGPQGGTILLPTPAGTGTYLIGSTIRLTKTGARLVGDGRLEITKAATLNGPAILMNGMGQTVEKLHVGGNSGNGGDGIVNVHKQNVIRDVQVYLQGRDGIRLGDPGDVGGAAGAETLNFALDHVASNLNGRHGIYLDDAHNSPPQVWGGHMSFVSVVGNTGDGIRWNRASNITVVSPITEGNGGYGINIGPDLVAAWGVDSYFLGGEYGAGSNGEQHNPGNTLGDFNVGANVRSLTILAPPDLVPTIAAGATVTQLAPGTLQINTVKSPGPALTLQGNRPANSASADVNIWSSVVRTNGYVLAVGLGADPWTTLFRVKYDGTCQSAGYPMARKVDVPASAGAAGSPGDYATDENYLYICTATNTWVRTAVATW